MAPDLDNHTPFSALAFSQFHRDGTDMAVLAVRGSFHLVPGQPLALAPHRLALGRSAPARRPGRSGRRAA